MDETNGLISEINAYQNLLGQLGDPDAKRKAGLINDAAWKGQKARALAYTAAIAKLEAGEEVTDEQFDEILVSMQDLMEEPTQEEINAANIDYLLMLEGE